MLQYQSNVQGQPQDQQQQQIQQTTMRLREDPPAITPPARPGRKPKSPQDAGLEQPSGPEIPPPPPAPQQQQQQQQQGPPPPPPGALQHVLPPPHALMHPPPHGLPPQLPPGFAYTAVPDYTPGGLPPGLSPVPQPGSGQQPQQQASRASPGGRALSNSKRAEQNRKAQRAFRERRDQHVKYLETRSQLLDAALQSADEANRRWEECRGLVDQLRVENAALRAALSHAGLLPASSVPPPPPMPPHPQDPNHKDHPEQRGEGPSAAGPEQKHD